MRQPVHWLSLCHPAQRVATGSLVALAWSLLLPWTAPPLSAQTDLCEPLDAVGGDRQVSKMIQLNNPLVMLFGRTNFNTDFTVTDLYRVYWLNIQSDQKPSPSPTGPGGEEVVEDLEKDLFPVVSYLKFSDRSNLRVFKEDLFLDPGELRRLGPFYPPQGKLVTEVNMKVGSSARPNSSGLHYTISAEGCL